MKNSHAGWIKHHPDDDPTGHLQDLAQLRKNLMECEKRLTKCSQPVPVRLQVPVPSETQKKVVTGVSVGVIAYWIISEVSRLIPIRNLIPVP